jgi:hypothetical protein
VAQTQQPVRDIKAMPAELNQAAQLDTPSDRPLASLIEDPSDAAQSSRGIRQVVLAVRGARR